MLNIPYNLNVLNLSGTLRFGRMLDGWDWTFDFKLGEGEVVVVRACLAKRQMDPHFP